MKADIVFLVKNRLAFTIESWCALIRNTNWAKVASVWIYCDMGPADDGAIAWLDSDAAPRVPGGVLAVIVKGNFGGPVNIMRAHLEPGNFGGDRRDIFAKVDNDVIVPPGWFDAGAGIMEAHPGLSFLGLEPPASRTRSPYGGKLPPAPEHIGHAGGRFAGYAPCDAIGGVGFMRRSAWEGHEPMIQHSTYGGFTDWQLRPGQSDLVKGWIVPPLKLFLLDRLPIEPWASLSKEYEAKGLQRFWTRYSIDAADQLWGWWAK